MLKPNPNIAPAQGWILRMDDSTPSLNVLLRMSAWEVKAYREEWALRVRASRGFTLVPKAAGPRRLIITRHGRKLLDQDNLTGGCKLLIDGIRKWGLLVDDRPEFLHLEVRQQLLTKGQRPHTTVQIEEVAA